MDLHRSRRRLSVQCGIIADVDEADDFAEAGALSPDEDPDTIYLYAWMATRPWRQKLAPFQEVRFRYIESDMASIGRRLMTPPAAPMLGPDHLEHVIYQMGVEAACWREWAADPMDHVASGW